MRLVRDNVEPAVINIAAALSLANELELDLVEISPKADPPVCRIIDYKKFLYAQKKKQKEKLKEYNKRRLQNMTEEQKEKKRIRKEQLKKYLEGYRQNMTEVTT